MLASWRVMPGVLLDTMTEHYSSPGRLADYRRRFEGISRKPEDPSVFVVELDISIEGFWGFESVGAATAGARLIYCWTSGVLPPSTFGWRGAGHSYPRYCGPMPYLKSHAEDSDCRGSVPMRNRPLPVYPIEEVRMESGPVCSSDDQDLLESLSRHLLPTPVVSPPTVASVPSEHEQFVQ